MGEKLKIAMLGQKRVPSHEGGIEIVVEELSTRMAAKGHDVTLYNRGGHHVSGKEFDSQKLTEYKSVKLKSVPTIDRKGLAAVSSSFLVRLELHLESTMLSTSMLKDHVLSCGFRSCLERDVWPQFMVLIGKEKSGKVVLAANSSIMARSKL